MGSEPFRTIPDKHFFKIGQVTEITGVKPYVLRYWETEFEWLRPEKTSTGQRVYSRKDVELVLLIDELLHQRRYTIEGARQVLTGLAGDWTAGRERLASNGGLSADAPVAAAAPPAGQAGEREGAEAKSALDRCQKEMKDLKTRYLKLTRELLEEKEKNKLLSTHMRQQLKELLAVADKDPSQEKIGL